MTRIKIVLVGIQLPENLGAVARAMGNFSLTNLHLVRPTCNVTDDKAIAMAAGNSSVLKGATIHHTLHDAVSDCDYVLATSASVRDMNKPLFSAETAAKTINQSQYNHIAIVFGPERTGLLNEDIALCQGMIQIPTDPEFSSLNISQAAIVVCYEFFKAFNQQFTILPFREQTVAVTAQRIIFLKKLECILDDINFWRNPNKKPIMWRNIQNIFTNYPYTQQEIKTLTGIATDIIKNKDSI